MSKRITSARGVRLAWLGGLAGLLLTAGPAAAASINYGDFDDIPPGTVMFLDVTESSGTDPVPLFGSPSVLGNVLSFDPNGFAASAAGGSADITDGQLNFTAEALSGYAMESLTVSEFGDYTLAGAGTTVTSVVVGIVAFATITEVDGAPITPFTVNASMSQQFDLVNDPGIVVPWSGGLSIDLNQALADEGLSYNLGVTEFDYVMNNQLLAFSEPGTIAFISKKGFGISLETRVPEPSTFTLVLGGLAMLRRRRR
jgi:hypothetical protein